MKSSRNIFAAQFVRKVAITSSIALSFVMSAASAATFTFNGTTTGTTQWTTGPGWDATPVSASSTTLVFGNGATLAASAAVVSNNNIAGDFKLNALNMTYAGPTSGAAPTLTVSGNRLEFVTDTATTPTMVFNTSGTVKPAVAISNNLLLTNDLTINTASNASLGGEISGAGNLTKSGAAVLTLSGLNSYTGTTTITNGALGVGTFGNGTLGVGGLLFGGGVIQGNGTFTRNFNTTNANTAANGEIAGKTGGFAAKGGALTVNFGGLGATVTLSDPSFRLGDNFILGSSTADSKVTVVNPIALNGSTRKITVNPGMGNDLAEFSGALSGATNAGINKLGTGLLILSGNNTYPGNTLVSAGTLAVSSNNALGTAAVSAANITTVSTGASLQLTNGIVTDINEPLTISGTGFTNVGALQAGTGGGTWAGSVTLGASSTRIGATPGDQLTVTGAIGDGINTELNISGGGGTGVVVLAPDTANTYSGKTTIIRGILRLGKSDALPVGTVLNAKNTTTDLNPEAASFDMAGFNQTLAGLEDTTFVPTETITNSAAATTSTLTISNSSARTYDGIIENGVGFVEIVKQGVNSQTFTGANTYSGTTSINLGILAITHSNALGDLLGNTMIAATGNTTTGGRLTLSNDITVAENFTFTGNSEVAGGYNATIDSISGTNSLTGTITLVGTGGQRLQATGTLNLNGPITRDGTNSGSLVLRTGTNDSLIVVNNTINLNNSGLNVQGPGTVILNVASTNFASTTIAFGSSELTLKLGINNALPITGGLSIGTANVQANADQGIFDMAGFNQTVNSLSAIAAASDPSFRKVTNSAGSISTLTVGNGGGSNVFNGVIEDGSGGVALTKIGTGTLILPADNTYTGATAVDSGALRVTGSLAAGSAVGVGVSGTLSGTGTINGNVTVSGVIAPGVAGVGTLTTGPVTLPGTLAVEIDGATGDKLLSTESVKLSGPLTVALLSGGFTQSSYVVAEGTSLTGTFSSVPAGYTVTYNATQAILSQSSGSDYTTWATSFGLQDPWLGTDPALNGEASADPDGDGMTNRQEYAFGLIPTSGSSVNPIIEQLDKSNGTFKYTRRATPATTGLTYTVKTTTNLANWSKDVTATATQSVIGTAGSVETVQVTLTGAPLAAPKIFARVEAE